MNGRLRGFVRKWDEARGFGFIEPDGKERGAKDIFCHFTALEKNGPGRRNLAEGDRVEFSVEQTEKGPQAVEVRLA